MKNKKNPLLTKSFWISSILFTTITLFLIQPSNQSSPLHPLPPPPNPRLLNAYVALQKWKLLITSDSKAFTSNWYGPNVCTYNGVYCAPAPDDSETLTVAGLDLNHADISGYLPEELGFLTDLALFHINSNRFMGTLPYGFRFLKLLFELDVSNNRFSGEFPSVVLSLPSLKFLDIRFNLFRGNVPSKLFDMKLDAIFLNDNGFTSSSLLPSNLGNSSASVMVLANNNGGGGKRSCVPASLTKMAPMLTEVILINMGLTGCLQPNLGGLDQLTVFDVSFNELVGPLPVSVAKMRKLEQLNVGHNSLSGEVSAAVCGLPLLRNFTYSYNYFDKESSVCLGLPAEDDRGNCIPNRPLQRSVGECKAVYLSPVDCSTSSSGCVMPVRSPPTNSPPPTSRALHSHPPLLTSSPPPPWHY
ncbi:Leucine-rich repeat extensin-like protein 6 [Linum grandiflorum]